MEKINSFQKLSSLYSRLNDYLITKQPFLWQTQIHLVVIYFLFFSLFSFLFGFFSSITFPELCLETEKIARYKTDVSIVCTAVTLIFVIYWRKKIVQYKTKDFSWRNSIAEVLVYSFGILLIWISSNTFYVGINTKIGYATLRMDSQEKAVLEKYNYLLPLYYVHNDTNKVKDIGPYFANGDRLMKNVIDKALNKKGPYLRIKFLNDPLTEYPNSEYFGAIELGPRLNDDNIDDPTIKYRGPLKVKINTEELKKINNYSKVEKILFSGFLSTKFTYSFKGIIPSIIFSEDFEEDFEEDFNEFGVYSIDEIYSSDIKNSKKLLTQGKSFLPEFLLHGYIEKARFEHIFLTRLNFVESLNDKELDLYENLLGFASSKLSDNAFLLEPYLFPEWGTVQGSEDTSSIYGSFLSNFGQVGRINMEILNNKIAKNIDSLILQNLAKDSLFLINKYRTFLNTIDTSSRFWFTEYLKQCSLSLPFFSIDHSEISFFSYGTEINKKIIDSVIHKTKSTNFTKRIDLNLRKNFEASLNLKIKLIDSLIEQELFLAERTSIYKEIVKFIQPYHIFEKEKLPWQIKNYLRARFYQDSFINVGYPGYFSNQWFSSVKSINNGHMNSEDLSVRIKINELQHKKTSQQLSADSSSLMLKLDLLARQIKHKLYSKNPKLVGDALSYLKKHERDFFWKVYSAFPQDLDAALEYNGVISRFETSLANPIYDPCFLYAFSSLYQHYKYQSITDSEKKRILTFLQKNKLLSTPLTGGATSELGYIRYYGVNLFNGIFEVQKAKNYLQHFFGTEVFQSFILALLIFLSAIFYFTLSFETKVITAAFTMAFLLIILTNLFLERYTTLGVQVEKFFEGLSREQIIVIAILVLPLLLSTFMLILSRRKLKLPGFLLNMVVVFAITILSTEPTLYYGKEPQHVKELGKTSLVPQVEDKSIDQLDLYFFLTVYLGGAILLGSVLVKRNDCLPERKN